MDPYTTTTLPDGDGFKPTPATPPLPARRRRSLGVLFRTSRHFRYAVCAGIVAVGAVSVPTVSHLLAAPQPRVLEAVRTLPAGHVISSGDLVAVSGRPQRGSLLDAGQVAALLGRRLKLEVPAGALLAPGDFGSFPPTGMSVVPVAVKPGQYPPNLQGGDQVAIFPISSVTGGTTQPAAHAAATAQVVQVQPAADASGTMVVLLETPTTMAPAIAQAQGVVLVILDAQGDTP